MWRLSAILLTLPLVAQSPKYGLGHTPTPEEVRAFDTTVAPDGTGLPPGSGSAAQGREVYERRCQRCHGAKGEGSDSVPVAGGTIKGPKPLKTVGSFWPYATTLWDYTNRAMPFNTPGMLTHDQVYAVTAYVLYMNQIVGLNDVLDAKSLAKIEMPNRKGFVPDPRPDVGKKKR